MQCARCDIPIADNTKTALAFDLKPRKLCVDCADKFSAWFGQAKRINAEYGGKPKVFIKCPNCFNEINATNIQPGYVHCNYCLATFIYSRQP